MKISADEKRKDSYKAYYTLHRAAILSKNKEYQKLHREERKEHYKVYRKSHCAEIKKSRKKYYASNRDTVREHNNMYKKTHPDYMKIWHNAHRDMEKNKRMKKAYGITLEQFQQMLTVQEQKCPICNKLLVIGPVGTYAIDHDHITGKVRQILCSKCNKGLGMFNDDSNILQQAVDYLKKWK